MTRATARFIGFLAAHHDRGGVVARGSSVDEALIAAGRPAAHHADRVELVDHFGDRQQLGHRPEGLSAEIYVGAGDDHAQSTLRERRRELHDSAIEKLRFIDADDLRVDLEAGADLLCGVDRHGFDRPSIVARHGVDPRIPRVQMGLEYLRFLPRDDRAPHPPNELLAFPAEHHTADHFDPSTGGWNGHVGDHLVREGGRGGREGREPRSRREAPPFEPPRSRRPPSSESRRSRPSSILTRARLPRIETPVSLDTTVFATVVATSTVECRSRMSTRPISVLEIPPSFVIAPTRSPGRTPSISPTFTNTRVMAGTAAAPAAPVCGRVRSSSSMRSSAAAISIPS